MQRIVQLAALFKAHGIKRIVICPGSQALPLTQTFIQCSAFTCYPVSDERSAGYYALGLALHDGTPTAVVSSSGSALINLYPAVAEACYQKVPLIIVSADKQSSMNDKMDIGTFAQEKLFKDFVKKSVSLPLVNSEDDLWTCNVMINDAILETNHHGKGPVHINIPFINPIELQEISELPFVRVITRYQGLNRYEKDYQPLIDKLNSYKRRLAVVGQMNMIYFFDKKNQKLLSKQFAWFTENLSNKTVPGTPLRHFDEVLYALDKGTLKKMSPDLLITYGGNLVSPRLKYFLRNYPPTEHWHISVDGELDDICKGALTTVIEMDPFEFLEKIAPLIEDVPSIYPKQWEQILSTRKNTVFEYSSMRAVGELIARLHMPCTLHLSNGSAVTYAQLFDVPPTVEVLSNRGIQGKDGGLSTAMGYSLASEKINFIIVGDLSFFCDMNSLWNRNYGANVRILVINNGGAESYHSLPGIQVTDNLRKYICGSHSRTVKSWAVDCGFTYMTCSNLNDLLEQLSLFCNPSISHTPLLLEVFTDQDTDVQLLKEYYKSQRK